ncbi:hypothetical protein [Methylibium sp.]|uniref:hypothetical protein n=1 Tax=Methylibium sp. TaxID=2067992 RepID=UPI0017D8D993|nr:hypothetical protein [Methylibium sp.]MBA3588319.1 hypothetical protein [Methylibium sp.]
MTPDTDRDSVPVVAHMHLATDGRRRGFRDAVLTDIDRLFVQLDGDTLSPLVLQRDHLAALASLTQRCEAAERLLDEAQTHAYTEGRRDEREERDEQELRGENAVLAGLLRDCDAVMETIEPDDSEEGEKLSDLRMALAYALDPYKREGTLLL